MTYSRIHFNPLNNWDKGKTKQWIEQRKMKFKGSMDEGDSDSDMDIETDQH